jgi:hypothetical protein
MHLRLSAPVGGLQWWCSYVLGFLLSYAHRYFLRMFISRRLAEGIQDMFIYESFIWAPIDIFPFELPYRFVRRTVCQLVLAAGHLLVENL